jgi:hypothetical protein
MMYRNKNRDWRIKILLINLIFSFINISCATIDQYSSGFNNGDTPFTLPEGIPKKVGVVLFEGDEQYSQLVTEQFSAGLLSLGFTVVERRNIEKVIFELELQNTGLMADQNRIALGKQLGLDGIIFGTVSGHADIYTIMSYVTVRLVDIENGKTIWSCSVKDPRLTSLDTSLATSMAVTTKEALRLLKSDLSNRK